MQTLETLNKAQAAAVAQYREWCETNNAREAVYLAHQAICPEGKSHWGKRECRECISLYEHKMSASRAALRYYNLARDKRVTMVLLNKVVNDVDAAARAAAVASAEAVEPVVGTPAAETTPEPSVNVADDAQDVADDADDVAEAPQEVGVAFGAVVAAEIESRLARAALLVHSLRCSGCDDVHPALARDDEAAEHTVQWRVLDLQRAGGTDKEVALAYKRGRDAVIAFVS